MRDPQRPADTDVVTLPSEQARADGLRVLLVGADGFHTAYGLPEPLERGDEVRVVLGRSSQCDLVVHHVSISRRHVALRIGARLAVQDQSSANGTFVRGQRVEPEAWVEIALGEPVEIGELTLVVQRGAVAPAVARVGERAAHGQTLVPPPPPAAAPARPPRLDVQRDEGGDDDDAPIVRDPAMARVYELFARVGAGNINVLLLGETGVGKDVAAAAVHRRSSRARGPFVQLNCAALSPTLLEAELFGHEKGAFTGADQARAGLIESADGGTVFLDEVGELPLALQVKLLRVLEDRKVLRVGALRPRPVDVRFVAATNRDLPAEVERGAFRQDLYFRLNGVAVVIPPLRERPSEIEPLARRFVARASRALGRARPYALSPGLLALLRRHRWPGNVRELRNAMERAVLLAGDAATVLDVHHLPAELTAAASRAQPPAAPSRAARDAGAQDDATGAGDAEMAGGLRTEMEALERRRILDALEKCAGNQTRAAQMLGIPRRTLIKRLEAYEVPRPRKKP